MNRDELADAVLRQVECLWILQELTYELSQGNVDADRFLEKVYRRRNPAINWRELHFLEVKTTLAMLILPTCFVSKLTSQDLEAYDFRMRDAYDVLYREKGEVVINQSPQPILHTMRNALAHFPDFAAGRCDPNIAFNEGFLRFWSEHRSSEVVFRSHAGFMQFLADLMRLVRRCAVELGNPQ